MDPLRKKLTDCKFFMTTGCTKGASCEFRHSDAAKNNTQICFPFQDNKCLNPRCTRRHPAPVAAPTDNSTCWFFANATCTKGSACPFRHIGESAPRSGAGKSDMSVEARLDMSLDSGSNVSDAPSAGARSSKFNRNARVLPNTPTDDGTDPLDRALEPPASKRPTAFSTRRHQGPQNDVKAILRGVAEEHSREPIKKGRSILDRLKPAEGEEPSPASDTKKRPREAETPSSRVIAEVDTTKSVVVTVPVVVETPSKKPKVEDDLDAEIEAALGGDLGDAAADADVNLDDLDQYL